MGADTIRVTTSSRSVAVDITQAVAAKVRERKVSDGLCVVYVPHTTAGVTINEGADPAVMEDVMNTLNAMVPWRGPYKHMEGNSAAHIKTSLVGSSVQVLVEKGQLQLGTWQRIFLCEFDGPRTRKVRIALIPGSSPEAV
ncbi:secondary thiamine-phosphate synthase enzyme [Desulfacinum hydrothermale DSM 13146]|uniref:Secondary thiamine-phosphate synthase enzyme n=1 Tax=Desulfacinum hydrothermale DSM 13146 TaxID=1121390 RepID=A0A1W1XAY9_9BACT|nr:secondary thiamine-phosphate synthase enzyme YjbQ [Desulfacinum hydrothermale]SMC20691.1 secondary thiamine-phosphate synthase enzyme [Desulfacinum hydrothermale DSM 13146]